MYSPSMTAVLWCSKAILLVRQTQGKINLIRFSSTAEVLCEPVSTLNAKKDVFEDFGIRRFNSTPFNKGLDCNTKETKEERNL